MFPSVIIWEKHHHMDVQVMWNNKLCVMWNVGKNQLKNKTLHVKIQHENIWNRVISHMSTVIHATDLKF